MRLIVIALVAVALLAKSLPSLAQDDAPQIWDLTDGEDKGVGAGFDVVEDLRQPPWIFKYTYNQKKTISVGNKRFMIPDFVRGSSMHRAIAYNETRLTKSWQDYYQYHFKSLTISLAANMGDVSLRAAFTGTKGRINQLLTNGTRSFGFNGATYITFQLQFSGMQRPAFDDDFARDLRSLPQAYDSNAYRRFIRSWGTHYFTRALYGCQFNMTVSFDNKFIETRNVNWATKNLDASIKVKEIEFGIKTEKVVNKSNIDGDFQEGTKGIAMARGGDESKFVLGKDFDGWLASCATLKAALVPYSEVEPMTEVITDRAVKENMRRAIIEYGQGAKNK